MRALFRCCTAPAAIRRRRCSPEPLHDAFARRQFNGFSDARTVYTLANGNMLVLSPPLRRALSVVRRLQSAAPATRRDLFANPRAYLREALGDDDETLIENVFCDTPAYSERVKGLGLWQPRVVPWVRVAATDWFAGADGAAKPGSPAPTASAGIRVGDAQVELTPAEADDLRGRVEAGDRRRRADRAAVAPRGSAVDPGHARNPRRSRPPRSGAPAAGIG